ncbi:PGPGW domain-containing protein, partial [uncultured Desulfobulbus sp.]|uniref:PGPGW domain-containing protein n=1 Tax=uncultured Desulfobulbus sp. TaxID=239745 RepID=UPI002616B562
MTPADLLTLLGLLSVVTFVGSLVAVPWLIGRMRADYFLTHWQVVQARHRRHPALALTVFLARNALGLLLVAAGLAMLFLPGQGLLTVLIGVCVMDFPGKRGLLQRLVRGPKVQGALNWIRR